MVGEGGYGMTVVFLTALMVGGATMLGAGMGFLFRQGSDRVRRRFLDLSAGIMLAAAILGLILPSAQYGGTVGPVVTTLGVMTGAVAMGALEGLLPRLRRLAGVEGTADAASEGALLFVAAILIHKLPEGLAAGVGFGTESLGEGLLIAGGIALQNIPEGMVVIVPMLHAGATPRRAVAWSLATAVTEALGCLAGFWAVTLVRAILPFCLAFAGGTMLLVLLTQMLPQARENRSELWVLAGFCGMLMCSQWLE